MSRSGYTDDYEDNSLHLYRGAVASAIKGRRGQAFLKEMLAAMDAMPVKRLVAGELEEPDQVPCSHWGLYETQAVCAIGTVGQARGVDMSRLDPEDADGVASKFGIAEAMAREIVYMNDEGNWYPETPEQRFDRMRKWIVSEIRAEPSKD